MQGIRTRHGHLDLRSKNGKTSWNAIEFALLAFTIIYIQFLFVEVCNLQKWFTERATLPDQNQTFFDAWFPTGEEHIPVETVETHPRPDSNISTNSCNYNKPVCDSWGYMNMK